MANEKNIDSEEIKGKKLEDTRNSLFAYVKEFADIKYESELRRETSLLTQASNMQTTFSFISAAILMALPIVIEYRGHLSINYIFVAVSSILFCLVASLWFATLAQKREEQTLMPSVFDFEKFVSDNWEKTQEKSSQLRQMINVIGEAQLSLNENNNKRVKRINKSMTFLFVAIFLIVFWYVVAVLKQL